MSQEQRGHGASIHAKHAEKVQDCGEDRVQGHSGSLTHSCLWQTDMPYRQNRSILLNAQTSHECDQVKSHWLQTKIDLAS